MRYFERSRSRETGASVATPVEPTDAAEARAAVRSATARLTESHRRWPAVLQVTRNLGETAAFNHFGDKLAEAYRSQPDGPSH
jgi:hypothetical protein